MVNQTIITFFTFLNIWIGDGNGPASRAHIAQATADQVAADRVAAQVVSAEARGALLISQKTALLNRYEAQLKEIDRLKQRRASWRRDRMLRAQLAESHATARGLHQIELALRKLNQSLRGLRTQLVSETTRELGKAPAGSRRGQLIAWRDRARQFLRPRSRKIVLPDATVDPLADPEDLDEQAAQLVQTERRLAREMSNLRKRAARFRRMDRLRRLRARAAQLRQLDNNRPRRSTGRLTGPDRTQGAGLSSNEQGDASPVPTDDFSQDPSVDNSNPVIVLANVVNTSVLEDLRRAESSNDPVVKASAAERAFKQVSARLDRLRKQRQLIIQRARSLRRRR